jgi:hypothetical protein
LSAPLVNRNSLPSSSLTITDIRFRALLNSRTFKILYDLPKEKKKEMDSKKKGLVVSSLQCYRRIDDYLSTCFPDEGSSSRR